MILKKLNIGNRNEYDILIIDGISDIIGDVAILKNNLPHDPQPYVIAYGYDMVDGTWNYGKYFSELSDAKKSFYKHMKGLMKNEK